MLQLSDSNGENRVKQKFIMHANQTLLYQHVEFLTKLRPFRNHLNIASLDHVRDYMKQEFATYGLEVIEQPFEVNGRNYCNVIASYNSVGKRRLIVGAHYDVCGDQPGADDNASAVAGLLESARMVASEQPAIDYRIDFVAFCLEEPPYYGTHEMGSYVHANSIKHLQQDLIGLINFEMIGYFNEGDQPYPDPRLKAAYPQKANFIAVVGKQKYHAFNQRVFDLMKAKAEIDAQIDVQIIDHPMVESLAGMSDQRSYWEFDIPALMINDTSFLRNPHYHQMSDDIETLSFDHMKKVVTCTYNSITNL